MSIGQDELLPNSSQSALPQLLDLASLNSESQKLLNKIISSSDLQETKDLTYLFNINQNKKTTIRINKLNELLDLITNQAMHRLTQRPGQISNKELLDSLRIVQTSLENSQRQVSGQLEQPAPFIQINQQNNEISVGAQAGALDRQSRDRVKNAVLSILQSINHPAQAESGQTFEQEQDSGEDDET